MRCSPRPHRPRLESMRPILQLESGGSKIRATLCGSRLARRSPAIYPWCPFCLMARRLPTRISPRSEGTLRPAGGIHRLSNIRHGCAAPYQEAEARRQLVRRGFHCRAGWKQVDCCGSPGRQTQNRRRLHCPWRQCRRVDLLWNCGHQTGGRLLSLPLVDRERRRVRGRGHEERKYHYGRVGTEVPSYLRDR